MCSVASKPLSLGGALTLNVILVHPSLNPHGGAEKVCVRMMEALFGVGHDVTLYTIEKTNWKPIETSWGMHQRPREVWCLRNKQYPWISLIRWPLLLILYVRLLVKAAKKRSHVSLNNYGEVLPLFADVSYVHSLPLSASINENPFSIPLWGAVKPLYQAMLRIFSHYSSGLILTNSRYNAGKINTPRRSRVLVLYPPVDPQKTRDSTKTPTILTISRLSRSKNLTIIPKIARLVTTSCEFNVCLSTDESDPADITLLQGPNIKIYQNQRASTLTQLRQASMIYLSTQPTEAFGLSIIEAMGEGCIPLVPKDGGPWHDILEEKQGEAGFAYETPAEAAKLIDKILNDTRLAEKTAKATRIRSRKYQGPTFNSNLLRLLESVNVGKTRNV